MKKLIPPAVMALALLAAACGGGDHDGDHGASGATIPADAPFNAADVAFAQGMIVHHAQAIEMADLVDGRGASPEVTVLAAQIKAAQDPEMELMSEWLSLWDQPVPDLSGPAAHGEHGSGEGMMTDEEMNELEAASGAEFDRLFLEMMIRHHEGAITMSTEEIDNGKFPEAIELAEQIIVVQQAEINEMQLLLDANQ